VQKTLIVWQLFLTMCFFASYQKTTRTTKGQPFNDKYNKNDITAIRQIVYTACDVSYFLLALLWTSLQFILTCRSKFIVTVTQTRECGIRRFDGSKFSDKPQRDPEYFFLNSSLEVNGQCDKKAPEEMGWNCSASIYYYSSNRSHITKQLAVMCFMYVYPFVLVCTLKVLKMP